MRSAVLAFVMIAAAAPATARSRHHAPPAILDNYGAPNPLLTPVGVNPAATLYVICITTIRGRCKLQWRRYVKLTSTSRILLVLIYRRFSL